MHGEFFGTNGHYRLDTIFWKIGNYHSVITTSQQLLIFDILQSSFMVECYKKLLSEKSNWTKLNAIPILLLFFQWFNLCYDEIVDSIIYVWPKCQFKLIK